MRKIRDVLRLHFELQLSNRQIAKSVSIGRGTVSDYLARLRASGLPWPLPQLSDDALEQCLFPGNTPANTTRLAPDWPTVQREMRRPGVTLQLLWEEYRLREPGGYQYSRFCQLYRLWLDKADPVMRQTHRAGETLFVDYAGHTVSVIDRCTGEARQAQIFVAVLGASNFTYCEATWSQQLPDWIASHQRALRYLGGVPQTVVPDNLRSGVTRTHRVEPEINRSYLEMAEHYGVAILPARPRKPRDKAKVETGVQIVERLILAALRNRQFFSLGDLNRALAELLERLNTRPFKKLPGCRREAFESIDC